MKDLHWGVVAALAAVGGAVVTGAYYGKQYGIGPFARMFYNPENFQEHCGFTGPQMEQLLAGEMMAAQIGVAEGWLDMNAAIGMMEDGAMRIMATCRQPAGVIV
jgi:hypothetical protein